MATKEHKDERIKVEGLQASLQKFKDDLIGIPNQSDAVYYTQEEADAYNALLTGALNSTDPLTAEEAEAYNEAVIGASKEAGDTLTEEEANAYNAILDGAVSTSDIKTPAVPKKVKDYVDGEAAKALPLTGGTMTGSVTMGTSNYIYGVNETKGSMLFFDGDRTVVGSAGSTSTLATHLRSTTGHITCGTDSTTSYTIWDSGNDGSDSGLDADLLDGLHASDLCRQYSYGLAAGKTVQITFSNYYQAIVTGRATNGANCGFILTGVGYLTTNTWRALYKGGQVSWCTMSSARGIEIKNTYSEGTLYINVLALRGTVTFEEADDLSGTPVTNVMAMTSNLDNYLPLAGGTMTGSLTLTSKSVGVKLNTSDSWTSSDRPIPFSMNGDAGNISMYKDDFTINPSTGVLKVGGKTMAKTEDLGAYTPCTLVKSFSTNQSNQNPGSGLVANQSMEIIYRNTHSSNARTVSFTSVYTLPDGTAATLSVPSGTYKVVTIKASSDATAYTVYEIK